MATNAVMKIVRGVVGKDATIYNDKLKNGVRSIKLDLWARKVNGVYELRDRAVLTAQAATQLQAAGYNAEIVTTNWGDTRLHVS